MTLAQLNEHLDAVQRLDKTEGTLRSLWDAAVPGAQKLTGMPHSPGVSDRVGSFAAEIADLEAQIDRERSALAESEERIGAWIATIADGTTRMVFRLRFVRGLTWKEVSQVLGSYTTERSVSEICYKYLKGNESNEEQSK